MQRQYTSSPRPAGVWWLTAIPKGEWHLESEAGHAVDLQ